MSSSLPPHGLEPARLLYSWNSSGKNTGVGTHSFLQGIAPTQGLNLGLQHCRQILYHLSHQGTINRGLNANAISHFPFTAKFIRQVVYIQSPHILTFPTLLWSKRHPNLHPSPLLKSLWQKLPETTLRPNALNIFQTLLFCDETLLTILFWHYSNFVSPHYPSQFLELFVWSTVVVVVVIYLLSCVWLFCDHMDCSPPGSS